MGDYRLVGLNGLGEIGVDEPCFTLEATQSCPDISVIKDPAVWAHLLNANPKDNALAKPENRSKFGTQNFNNPMFTQLRGGGPFRDKFGNTIFIRFQGIGLPERLYRMGYYDGIPRKGNVTSNMIHIVRRWDKNESGFESQGGGWHERWINRFRAKNDYNAIMAQLEQFGINQRKLGVPVIFYIDRGDVIAIDKYKSEIIEAMNIIALATAFFPGLGPFVATAVAGAAQLVSGFVANGNIDTSVSGLVTMGSAFLPEDSPIQSYVNDGAKLAKAIEIKDYKALGDTLGMTANALDLKTIEDKLANNDITTILRRSNKSFDEVHKITQAAKNAAMPGHIKAAMEITDLQIKMVEDDLSGDSWADMFEMVAGGGYPIVPVIKGDGNGTDDLMPKAIANHKTEVFNDPNLHKALMNMAMGMPVDPNTFDDFLVENYENKLSDFTSTPFKKQPDFTLPAGLSPAKRECFAKHLKNKGIEIILGEPIAMAKENHQREVINNKYKNQENGSYFRKAWM